MPTESNLAPKRKDDRAMSASAVADALVSSFDGLIPVETWGELAYFYNPGRQLKRGTYFATIKQKDGEHDRASRLDRPGVYRLNFSLPKPDYLERFGPLPDRPSKGGVICGEWDFTVLDRLTPHPVYGWMGWVSVLSPTPETFEHCRPLLALAHRQAVKRFERRSAKR